MKTIFFITLACLLCSPFAAARDVALSTDPAGAKIEIINLGSTRIKEGAVYRGPAIIDFSRRSEPYILEVTADGYAPERVQYDYNEMRKVTQLQVTLQPLRERKTFMLSSKPHGAAIQVDGQLISATPATIELEFNRSSKSSPWSTNTVRLVLEDHEDQELLVRLDSPANLPEVELILLRDEVDFTFEANSDGQQLNGAAILVDGTKIGETPHKQRFAFNRKSDATPWSTVSVQIGIADEFEFESVTLNRDSSQVVSVDLKPVTEVAVTRYFPSTEFTVRGPKLGMDLLAPLGMLDSRDLSTPYSDLRKVTNFTRGDKVLQAVNSFTLSSNGRDLIYSVTMENEDGSLYSNLYLKAASDQSFAFQQITRGNQVFDTCPAAGVDPASNFIVFQSNRMGRRNSWDISGIRIQDGRVIGGVVQLTHEPRFNFSPSMVSENRPAFFIGHDDFPAAEPYISSVRLDGSSYTVLGEVAHEVVYAESGKLFFVRKSFDDANPIDQIFSISSEGLSLSTVINDFEFSKANCSNPSISPDGGRMLFVSDYARDERDRPNNNLFSLDFATGRVQQLTDNGSDDIQPLWSPTEPNVVFFLSNREGVYNVWRMELVVSN